MKALIRLYQHALLAFPRRHRERYGAEMVIVFAHDLETRRRAGVWPAVVFAAAALVNVLAAGLGARVEFYRRNPATTRFISTLDVVLAWRMTLRYRGLSLISIFGIGIGIAVAAGAFTVVDVLTDARVPLPRGDRLVSLFNRDVATNNRESRLIHDFDSWRHLTALERIAIARTVSRNLIVNGATEPVTVAEISAAAFDIAGVPALRGRQLLPEDEAPSAPSVVVIGHDEWVRRFGGDADVIGRAVELGGAEHTIVGVMPEGFAFPVNHSFWIPWRADSTTYAPRTGPSVHVFGRLAPHASIESAQAELDALGARASAEQPSTHQHLRPRVVPYAYVFNDMDDAGNAAALRAIQFALALLLVVISVNVAILVYARTATRHGEIAVRGALGASRRRIVSQLFVEALLLAGVAAALGLVAVSIALPQLEAAIVATVGRALPFWMDFELSPAAMSYTVALTLLAAAIVGVVPAMKATGTDVRLRLQSLSGGGGSSMQMGRAWTLLIVAQVAVTVALLPAALFYTWDGLRLRTGDAGYASREFLSSTLAMDRSLEAPSPLAEAAFSARYGAAAHTLEQRLRENAKVRDVTFSIAPAGQELAMVAEAEGYPLPEDLVNYNIVGGSKAGHLVRYNRVAANFLDAFEVPVLLGRSLVAEDAGADRVVISRALAHTVFGADNPLGRRFKYVGRSREAIVDNIAMERWLEVVGVVADFPVNEVVPVGRVYHAFNAGALYPATISVRARAGNPEELASVLRNTSASVNAQLQVRDISTSEIIVRREQGMFRMIGATVGAVMLSVMILTAAGIYAMMSFTVTRRRREIGIRAALGADRNRILLGIFARATAQLAGGAALGLIAALGLEQILEGEMFQGHGAILVPAVIGLMAMVGLVATLGPARRGLSIQPIEALREE